MRLRILTTACVISLTVVTSACWSSPSQSGTPPSQTPAPTTASAEDPAPTPAQDTEEVSENPFVLSDEERKIFDEYSDKKDINILKGLPPISVAKIFIECGITGNWEAEYGLYAPNTVQMTKEQWGELNAEDISTLDLASRRTMADDVFSLIDEGQVTENSNGTAVITFKTYNGEVETKLHMVKHTDDIWLVKFDPFNE